MLFTALVWVNIRELLWLVLINVIYGYIGIFLRNRVKLEPNCLETPWYLQAIPGQWTALIDPLALSLHLILCTSLYSAFVCEMLQRMINGFKDTTEKVFSWYSLQSQNSKFLSVTWTFDTESKKIFHQYPSISDESVKKLDQVQIFIICKTDRVSGYFLKYLQKAIGNT